MGRKTSLESGQAVEKLSGWDKKVEGGSNDNFCPQGLRRGGRDVRFSQLSVAGNKVPEKTNL